MRNRAWKHRVVASILAAALRAAGSSKAEEKAQPNAFNSQVDFVVYAVAGKEAAVGSTPSKRGLTIPPCRWWYVDPRHPVKRPQMAHFGADVQSKKAIKQQI